MYYLNVYVGVTVVHKPPHTECRHIAGVCVCVRVCLYLRLSAKVEGEMLPPATKGIVVVSAATSVLCQRILSPVTRTHCKGVYVDVYVIHVY